MADVQERYEDYLAERAREVFRYRSGLVPELSLRARAAEIDDRFGDVTSGDLLDALEADLAAATLSDSREAARRLLVGVKGCVVAARTREIHISLLEHEAAQRLRVGKAERGVREWRAALAGESESSPRAHIQAALDRAWAELNPLREELCGERASVLADLGQPTARHWAEARRPGVDLDAWGTLAEKLLDATRSCYADALSAACAEAGVAHAAHLGDLVRVASLPRYARFFPALRHAAALDFTTEGMGVRLDDVPGITVDAAERAGKSVFTSAARVPGEVRISVLPLPGVEACEAYFSAAGRAVALAFTSPAMPVERRVPDEPTLSLMWGHLLGARLADPEWSDAGPARSRAEPFVRAMRFRRLLQARTAAAQLRFEAALSELGPGEDPRRLDSFYAEEQSEAGGVPAPPEGYLVDTSLDLGALDELRARCLEAQLAEHLRGEFGRRFWTQRAAGDLLKELWNTGTTLTAEGLCAELGLGPLTSDALTESLLHD